MAPTLVDLYSFVTLPRILDLKFTKKAVVPTVKSINTTHIDIGISKSIISSYVLKPTPKLEWSFPLSPSTIIEDMDVRDVDSKLKIYAVAITERKVYKILLIKKSGESYQTSELKVKNKIAGIKIMDSMDQFIVLYENGLIEMIQSHDEDLTSIENLPSSTGNIIFHSFISKNEFKNNKDLLLYVIKQGSNLVYKLICFDSSSILEVNSISKEENDEVLFAYNSGYLYKLDLKSKLISSLSINNFKHIKDISIAQLLKGKISIEDVSISCPSIDRLLLSIHDTLYLVNFKFECLLSKSKNSDRIYVKQVVKVKGDSSSSSKSIAIYLSSNKKNNEINLDIINIDVGLNKLSECLGKSLNPTDEENFKGLPNLMKDGFEEESIVLSEEVTEIFNALVECSQKKDIGKWERILIPYLKNESWDSVKKSLLKKKVSKDKIYQFQVFDVENDRILDLKFFKKILSLIFENDESGVKIINEEFLPEHTLIYLLTNPSFPHEFTNGLLDTFHKLGEIDLLRQCITTCPNLSLKDLISQLIIENDSTEIFEELLSRLIREFSIIEITKSFKKLVEKKLDIDLDSLLNKLIKVDNKNSWLLIQCIIDIGGLFHWSLDTLGKLNDLIESKYSTLIENNYNLTLTNQVLLTNEPIKKKSSKSKKKKEGLSEDIISANDQQKIQLDSILMINNNSSKKLLFDNNSSIAISKKIPNYSVERLIL